MKAIPVLMSVAALALPAHAAEISAINPTVFLAAIFALECSVFNLF